MTKHIQPLASVAVYARILSVRSYVLLLDDEIAAVEWRR